MIATEQIAIEEQDIHVWVCCEDQIQKLAEDHRGLLTHFELRRAAELRFNEDRDRFVSGRILMKILLGCYLQMKPKQINLYTTPSGKPFVEDPRGLQFNLSHSGGRVLIAFALNDSLGVDIEQIRSDISIESICRGYYSKEECRKVLQTSAKDRAEEFCRMWTRKEAVIKCVGKGLQVPLQSFSVSDNSGTVRWLKGAEAYQRDCRVTDLEVGEGYKAAVAIGGPTRRIQVYEFGS